MLLENYVNLKEVYKNHTYIMKKKKKTKKKDRKKKERRSLKVLPKEKTYLKVLTVITQRNN